MTDVSTAAQAPIGEVVAVWPGDMAAASQVDGWLRDCASSRDPGLRERIILAYLGLADRVGGRYHTSRGTTPGDLRQTARAGLIAAIDRYDPDYGNPFVPYAVACVVGRSSATRGTPAGGCMCRGCSAAPWPACAPNWWSPDIRDQAAACHAAHRAAGVIGA